MDRSSPPVPRPEVDLRLPQPERHRLPDGPCVVWIPRSGLPAVSLRFVVPAGTDGHDPEAAGLAALTGSLLTEGAAGRTSTDLADWIDGLGMSIGVSVRYDAAVVRAHALTEHLPEALDVLSAVALRRDFPRHGVDRVRDDRLDRIRQLRDDPDDVAADVLAELLYDGHPYGRLPRGRIATVERLRREDVVAFHEARYSPAAATLIACGEVPESFPDLIAGRFTGGRGPSTATLPPPAPARSPTTGFALVDRPGSHQSGIRIGSIGLARGAADECAARMMNALLGGVFNSRLNLNLRERRGWTYGARSALHLRRGPGPLILSAAVQTEVTAAAVTEMLEEAGRLRDSPAAAEEMATAAGALTRSLPLRFETTTHLAEALVEQVVYGLPDDYWSGFAASIRAVTAGELQEAARRYLDPERLVSLVVGDASRVGPDLARLGPVALHTPP